MHSAPSWPFRYCDKIHPCKGDHSAAYALHHPAPAKAARARGSRSSFLRADVHSPDFPCACIIRTDRLQILQSIPVFRKDPCLRTVPRLPETHPVLPARNQLFSVWSVLRCHQGICARHALRGFQRRHTVRRPEILQHTLGTVIIYI